MTLKRKDGKPAAYTVGYRKPPEASQFSKGRSGNPQGRPKGRRNVATVFQAALNERVTITENGQRKTITKLEAAMKQVVNRAAAGEAAAIKLLLQLFPFLNSQQDSDNLPQPVTQEADQQVLAALFKRYEGTTLSKPATPKKEKKS